MQYPCIKSHSTYKYNDLTCRGCGVNNEDPYHVINCGFEDKIGAAVDILSLDKLEQPTKTELLQMVLRMKCFLDKVNNDNNEDLMTLDNSVDQ